MTHGTRVITISAHYTHYSTNSNALRAEKQSAAKAHEHSAGDGATHAEAAEARKNKICAFFVLLCSCTWKSLGRCPAIDLMY
eukprot:scaffold29312_cov112-Isochrysis_galbana.AAC.1